MNHPCFNFNFSFLCSNTDPNNAFVYLWWNTAVLCVQTTRLSLCIDAIITLCLFYIFTGAQYTGLMSYQPGQRTQLLPLVWESLHLLSAFNVIIFVSVHLTSFSSEQSNLATVYWNCLHRIDSSFGAARPEQTIKPFPWGEQVSNEISIKTA